MKIQNTTFKVFLAIAVAALASQAADSANVSEGFAYPYSCGSKAAVGIETIPALAGQGIGGGTTFVAVTSTTLTGPGFDGAGFVWLPNPLLFPGKDLSSMEIFFEGDPKAAVISFCYDQNEGQPRTTGFAQFSRSFTVSEPDASGFRLATADKAQLEKLLARPLKDVRIHKIDLSVRGLGVKEIKPENVTFGQTLLIYRDQTVMPQLIRTPETGFRGCDLKNNCN